MRRLMHAPSGAKSVTRASGSSVKMWKCYNCDQRSHGLLGERLGLVHSRCKIYNAQGGGWKQ